MKSVQTFEPPMVAVASHLQIQREAPRNLGRWALIRLRQDGQAHGLVLCGTVIDCTENGEPRRIRIQRGDPEQQGRVVQPHEYVFRGWADEEED